MLALQGKRLNAWMYRKGAENPTNTNIKNIGVSIDFYTIGDDDRVDESITKLETDYGDVLARVRTCGTSSLITRDYRILKRLLAHCLIRTARVREMFRAMRAGTHTLMKRLAGDTQLLGNAIGAAMDDEDYLLDLLRTEVDKWGGRFSDEFLRTKIREQIATVKPRMKEHMSALTIQATRSVEIAMTKTLTAEIAHIKAIEKDGPEPATRIAQFDAQPFSVVHNSGEPLVLGDGLVIGIARDGLSMIDGLSPEDELLGWVMPITSEHFVYSGPAQLESLDIHAINDASVRLSHQFFLASERTEELTNRISDIGSTPTMVDRIDWEEMHLELARCAEDGEIHRTRNP